MESWGKYFNKQREQPRSKHSTVEFQSVFFNTLKKRCSFLLWPPHFSALLSPTTHLKEQTPLVLNLFHTLSFEARFNSTCMPRYHYLKNRWKVMMAVCVLVQMWHFSPTEATAIEFLNRYPDSASSWNQINHHSIFNYKKVGAQTFSSVIRSSKKGKAKKKKKKKISLSQMDTIWSFSYLSILSSLLIG